MAVNTAEFNLVRKQQNNAKAKEIFIVAYCIGLCR